MAELSTLVQGGGIGIALLVIWVNYQTSLRHAKELTEQLERCRLSLERNTAGWLDNAIALKGLTDKLGTIVQK